VESCDVIVKAARVLSAHGDPASGVVTVCEHVD
jgi:hypothetical protein